MKKYRVVVNGSEYVVTVEPLNAPDTVAAQAAGAPPGAAPAEQGSTTPARTVDTSAVPLTAPLRGTILKILVQEGARVKPGDVVMTLEALKLENEITAPVEGVVAQILVKPGDAVEPGDVLATFRVLD